MRRTRNALLSSLCLLIAACGSDGSGPEPSPAGLVEVLSEAELAASVVTEIPVRVRVLDTAGQPLAGARVHWAVQCCEGGTLVSSDAETSRDGVAEARWRLAATADTQVVRVRSGDAIANVRSWIRIARLEVEPAAARIAPGVTVHYSVRAFAADDVQLDTDGARVSSADPGVAAVDVSGAVTALRSGETRIAFTVAGATEEAPLVVSDVEPAVAGRLIAADSGVIPPMQVHVRIGRSGYSTKSAAGGAFAVRFATGAGAPAVSFEATTSYLPAWIAATEVTRHDLRIVMVPRVWRIQRGAHAGDSVAVSVATAFGQPCGANIRINCEGYYRAAWRDGITVWREEVFPLPVALDHSSPVAFEARDSVELWIALAELAQELGRDVYRPARTDDLTVVREGFGFPRARRGVLVRKDDSPDLGLAGAGALPGVNGDLELASAHFRNHDVLRNRQVVKHEFMHVLGFAHTCDWPSIMGGYCSTHPWTTSLTRYDVAYFELALRVRTLERLHDTPHGMTAALEGELRSQSEMGATTAAGREAVPISTPRPRRPR